MSPPDDSSSFPRPLARHTPDTLRWRRRIAGLAAVGAVLSLYATLAIVSGVKSGVVYNLLVLLFGVLTLVLPVVAATTLFAPDSGPTRTDSSGRTRTKTARGERPVEALKRRYAAGEIGQDEFERRLDGLVEADDEPLDGAHTDSVENPVGSATELDSTGR